MQRRWIRTEIKRSAQLSLESGRVKDKQRKGKTEATNRKNNRHNLTNLTGRPNKTNSGYLAVVIVL